MTKEKLFASKLLDVFEILGSESSLNFVKNSQVEIPVSSGDLLLKIDQDDINIPGVSIHENFFGKPSPLENDFVSDNQIREFISVLSKKESILKLNHVGFCYLVDSIKEEKERLCKLTNQRNLSLYEEESQYDSTWFFAGKTSKWYDPLVEFVLIKKTDDKWKDYWLPHFQIDIDTNLVVDDIESIITNVFDGKIKPYRAVVVNNYVCIVRARLGVIDGININLDIGTEGRMPRYHREKLIKEIVIN